MTLRFSLIFILVYATTCFSVAQVTMTEITDPVLTSAIINGVTVNSEGQTILYGSDHIYTYTNELTEDFICNFCYNILAVVSYKDTQYIANSNGGIYKRFGDSLAIIADNDANSLAMDKDGILYGNDYGNGFFRWDGTNVQVWNEANSNLPSDFVYDLAIDTNGVVWLATHAGLVSFNGNTFSLKSIPDELSATFYDVGIDQNNAVWVSSAYGGVGRFANNTWKTFPQTFTLLQLVQNIGILHGNEVWTASFDKGLYRYHNNQFTKYAPSFFGFSDFDNCAFLSGDAQGRLWMQFDNTPLMYLTTEPTAIHEAKSASMNVSISPNPTDGIVYLSIPEDVPGITYVQLFTSEGVLCQSHNSPAEQHVSLDMSHLSSGLYLAVVTDAKGYQMTQKIILR